MCSPLKCAFTRAERDACFHLVSNSLLFGEFFIYLFIFSAPRFYDEVRARGTRWNSGCRREWGGRREGGDSGGLPSVPDVSVRQHDGGSRGDRSEPPSGTVSTAEEGSTSVFTQNNQGPTLRAAQACY